MAGADAWRRPLAGILGGIDSELRDRDSAFGPGVWV